MKRIYTLRTLIPTLSFLVTMALLSPALASDNRYSVRVACRIPAVPGQNVPILQESKTPQTTERGGSPVIFEKNSREMRLIAGVKQMLDVNTLYSR